MGSWQDGVKDPKDDLKLRVGAIFVLLLTSAVGSILPILSKRYHNNNGDKPDTLVGSIAPAFFDFTKYLGSGIIIATAFVHLLSPAFEELNDPSLPQAWKNYDWASVLAMGAVFAIFTVELLAFRVGNQVLDKLGVSYDAHDHAHGAHGPCEATGRHDDDQHFLDGETSQDPQVYTIAEEEEAAGESTPMLHKRRSTTSMFRPRSMRRKYSSQRQLLYGTMDNHGKDCCLNDPKKIRELLQNGYGSPALSSESPQMGNGHGHHDDPYHAAHHAADHGEHHDSHHSHQRHDGAHHSAHQIIGVAILEFGVVLHSFVVGMTLAVVERFPTLFVVITLHQMFEGLGLGARLAGLKLPERLHWVPAAAALLFSAVTPLGLGVGLLVRKSYSAESPVALIVSGILDSLSAGILLYTGLVELLCAEFLFHQEMREAPLSRVLYALGCVILGAIAMSVLGIWA